MRRISLSLSAAAALGLAGLAVPLMADTAPTSTSEEKRMAPGDHSERARYKPDNTAVNERDMNSETRTADSQGTNRADTETIAKVRRSILEIENLSAYGRNVKIIARDGVVMLRGPVRTVEEKASIESRAQKVAGTYSVRSEIEVTPDTDIATQKTN